MYRSLAFVAALFVGIYPVAAQSLKRAAPAEVGFSADRLGLITQMLKEDTGKGAMPGAVILIARHGKIAMFEPVGTLDPGTKAPMTREAIFRIYSMSKPITTVAAMTLVEDGKILLNDPISKYLPQFAQMKVGVEKPDPAGGKPTLELTPARRPITVQDLMRHTSGITYGFFGNGMVKKAYLEAGVTRGDYTNAEFADRIAKMPLAYQPGTTWDYSHSIDILGSIIEAVSGKSLLEYEKQRLLMPLGMNDTAFYVTEASKQPRIAEPFPNDRVFGIEAAFNDPRIQGKSESGGGGMVSTTTDYARFLQMLLSGGALDGKRILSPKTIAYMTSDQLEGIVPGAYYLPGTGYTFGLGFAVRKTVGGPPELGSAGEYTWNGVGGTHFWVDPKEDLFVLFMMQSPKQRGHYMSLIRNMVYAAMEH